MHSSDILLETSRILSLSKLHYVFKKPRYSLQPLQHLFSFTSFKRSTSYFQSYLIKIIKILFIDFQIKRIRNNQLQLSHFYLFKIILYPSLSLKSLYTRFKFSKFNGVRKRKSHPQNHSKLKERGKIKKKLQTNFHESIQLVIPPCPYSATFDFADTICPHLRVPVGRADVYGRAWRGAVCPTRAPIQPEIQRDRGQLRI